jgi:hypothetical protein
MQLVVIKENSVTIMYVFMLIGAIKLSFKKKKPSWHASILRSYHQDNQQNEQT